MDFVIQPLLLFWCLRVNTERGTKDSRRTCSSESESDNDVMFVINFLLLTQIRETERI